MAKFFVASDIHSFFSTFKQSLDDAGFDPKNPEHYLIICGDLFDRGSEPNEVYDYFKEYDPHKILIRGNHEDLILDCIERGYYKRHDVSNGTVKTIMDLSGLDFKEDETTPDDPNKYSTAADITYEKVKPLIDRMVNYFETEHYIFTHSWIPFKLITTKEKRKDPFTGYIDFMVKPKYNPKWREANEEEWEEARWVNPYNYADFKLNKTSKTIVSGHWHTSWYRSHKNNDPEFGPYACFDPVYDKEHKFIGIDACTGYSGKCNIIVIEDNMIGEA